MIVRPALFLSLSLIASMTAAPAWGTPYVRQYSSTNHVLPSMLNLTIGIGPERAAPFQVTPLASLGDLAIDVDLSFARDPVFRTLLTGRINAENIVNRPIDLGSLGGVDVSVLGVSVGLYVERFRIFSGNQFNLADGLPFFVPPFLSVDAGLINLNNPTGLIGTLFSGQFPLAQNFDLTPIDVPATQLFQLDLPGAFDDDGPSLFDPKPEFNFTIDPIAIVIDEIARGTNLYVVLSGKIYTAVPEVSSTVMLLVPLAALTFVVVRRRVTAC
ncbi:hypothetical protein K2X85_06595 [bacterium]|nr:hypothetical protein [bacterium]